MPLASSTSQNRRFVKINFIGLRTRDAPLVNISIPRSELSACCIGARYGSKIVADLGIQNANIFNWMDSMTLLSWIRCDINWGKIVYERVLEIKIITWVYAWHHIVGKLNVANLPSRGCSSEQFLKLKW
ncbi:uncharacterized protein NPIL_598811 [Nephila pilipes]|uniref:Uncharacterized protein n=1 Tax=Nephila pilipes TaxID=299642 RepID=A0A8X6TAZ4_NEPPI|nr:uncharacterized protein NPIL_598811 [Nephila pilipes]